MSLMGYLRNKKKIAELEAGGGGGGAFVKRRVETDGAAILESLYDHSTEEIEFTSALDFYDNGNEVIISGFLTCSPKNFSATYDFRLTIPFAEVLSDKPVNAAYSIFKLDEDFFKARKCDHGICNIFFNNIDFYIKGSGSGLAIQRIEIFGVIPK